MSAVTVRSVAFPVVDEPFCYRCGNVWHNCDRGEYSVELIDRMCGRRSRPYTRKDAAMRIAGRALIEAGFTLEDLR